MATAKTSDPELDRIVERQLRNWEIARSQRFESEKKGAPREVQEFVTVSRQVGAGGSRFAAALHAAIGWPLFDREILQAMSQDDRSDAALYEWMDERDMGWLEYILDHSVRGRFPPHDYFHKLSKMILAIARGGHAIFLGRAADLILPRDHGLRIWIVAPRERRVSDFAARYDLTPELAGRETDRIERERAQFIRHHFNRPHDDPIRFDLVINMDRIAVDQAVSVVVEALRARGVLAP